MIPFLLATELTCSQAQGLVDTLNESKMKEKSELIEVVKKSTESGCYEEGKVSQTT